MLQKLKNVLRNKKGQGMVEYSILVGGIALVCLATVALMGHKTNDIISLFTAVLPGAHDDERAKANEPDDHTRIPRAQVHVVEDVIRQPGQIVESHDQPGKVHVEQHASEQPVITGFQ